MLSHLLCTIGNVRYGKHLDAEKAALIGLYHDASEIITGDMPTPVKYYNDDIRKAYKEVEAIAEDRLLDKLPAGFLRELYSGMPDSDTDRDSLHVYLVRNIPGDASAFANAWMEPMMVCFATEEYLPSQLPHEFMHLIDYRLNQYNARVGRDLENEWSRLSPWWAYDSWLTDKQQQEVEGYFVSLYARTNSTEDRAETFQALFDSEEPVSEQWWYAEHPGVQAKAAYLVKAIRAAFPSVQAVEAACWEKLP